MKDYFIIFPILFPIILGIMVLIMPQFKNRKNLIAAVTTGLLITSIGIIASLILDSERIILFELVNKVPITLYADGMGKLFVLVMTILWVGAGIYAFIYMTHEEANHRYFGYYLVTFGVLVALCYSENLITYYCFYEFTTLASAALVIHNRSHEAVIAGLKYLFYSFFGAYLVLFSIYFLYKFSGENLQFVPGGVISDLYMETNGSFILLLVLFVILGFGVKAGMFPLHGWLPTAHPVAPAPASAVLSGFIVKAGVLGIIRTLFYIVGIQNIRGTWVQYTWITLTLFTVFMGSMLAFDEKVLKKRLAYSTVSQVSYILFGLAVMEKTAMEGALLHVVCHALIKCGLFLCAGAIIYLTKKTRVDELRGIGKQIPGLMICYTILSLGLIGIPPTGGFISKWYLCIGALKANLGIFSILGPIVLLVSALLTAGYLLPISVIGFFPGEDVELSEEKIKISKTMMIPIIIVTVLVVLAGLFPNTIVDFIDKTITVLFS